VGFPLPGGVRFSADDLRPVRRVTARWAARLLLRVAGGAAQAEVRDSGCWQPAAGAASDGGRGGGMGLALARMVCDEVGVRAGAGGTTVMLRMSLLARRSGPR